jgi:hypothetical protein
MQIGQMADQGGALANRYLNTRQGITTGAGAIGHTLNALRGNMMQRGAWNTLGGQGVNAARSDQDMMRRSTNGVVGGVNDTAQYKPVAGLPSVPGVATGPIDKYTGMANPFYDAGTTGGNMSTTEQPITNIQSVQPQQPVISQKPYMPAIAQSALGGLPDPNLYDFGSARASSYAG